MELTATIPALLGQQAAAHGSETIFRKKDRGIWSAITWAALEEHVREIGQGLRASGLAAGGVVAMLSQTRPELAYADLAILGCGAVSVAIHPDEDEPRVGEILRETGAAFAVVEGEEQLDKVLGVRPDCPDLRLIIIIDMKGLRDFSDPYCVSMTSLIAGGAGQPDWKVSTSRVTAGQPAAILVSNTGPGRAMTHGEIMHQIDQAARDLDVRAGDERLVVLPMSDPTERLLGLYLALKYRIVSNYLENPETATENLREVKPTVFGADTEAWERLHDRTSAQADAATRVQKVLYQWAIGTGASGWGRTLANFLVLSAVRGQLGFGNLRVAYVGDGEITPAIDQWTRGLGIKVRYIKPFQQGGTHA